MALVVQKYGGSSLASPRHIRAAAERIRALKATGSDVVVVVSAMGRTTDHLIRLAFKTAREPAQRELDMLLTAGERVSMSLLAMALHELGVAAISFTGSQCGIITTSAHTDAKILDVRPMRIQEEIAKGRVVIVAGFQGVSREKEITTLGRGGSDTTAVAIAAVLKADRCEVLTDVDGIFTADPRLVPSARLIEKCDYEVALEMASLGAKMQSRSIEMARRYGVKLRVASSRSEGNSGTEIGPRPEGENMESTEVKGITTRDGYHFLRVKTNLANFASWIKSSHVPVRFFQATANEVSFLCEAEKVTAARKELASVSESLEEIANVAIVSVVGEGVSRCPDFMEKVLSAMTESDCHPLLVSTSTTSMTIAVPKALRGKLADNLHQKFISK